MPKLPKLPPPGPRGKRKDITDPETAEAIARFIEHRMTKNDTAIAGTVLRRWLDNDPGALGRFIAWYESL
jgi:hypothetical protein